MATSDAGALKARQLKLDANAFDTEDFLAKLRQFMGSRTGKKKSRARAGSEDGEQNEEMEDVVQQWTKVGRVLAMESRRVQTSDHMCVLCSLGLLG